MKARDKEQYLREYQILKSQGKPFFPYAVLKDSVMAAIVLAVIIAMAVILGAGELANKADPTTTTYTPRPEWYFFFLFELLRVIKPPRSDRARDGRHPDDLPGAAPAAAVLRPQPRAAPGAAPDRHHRRVRDDRARWPTSPTWARTPRRRTRSTCTCLPRWRRAERREPVRVRRLPQVRRGGQRRPRAGPDPHRREAPGAGDRAHAAATRRRPMPSYADLPQKKFDALVEYLSALR